MQACSRVVKISHDATQPFVMAEMRFGMYATLSAAVGDWRRRREEGAWELEEVRASGREGSPGEQ